MKKAAFITLGCRVNQYETQCVREELFQHGFEEVSPDEDADVYFVNTCAVTGESVRKDRQMIRRILRKKEENPSCVVCVCGCFSQGEKEDVPLFEKVDVLTGNTGKNQLAGILASLVETPPDQRKKVDLREDISRPRAYEKMSLSRSHNARAFVKIQDGCNSFCSYCYVPLVRGRVRSRQMVDVISEVCNLSKNGYREIVLTGIETGSWGEDFDEDVSLCDLVERVNEIEGIERIRFGSLKPSVFTEEFCSRLAALKKVLPHFHLSLQSGSTRILSLMGRRYGRKEEEEAIERIYRYFPDAGLSADLICGFPGEGEEDFEETVSLVKKAKLLHTHIFPFSPRSGTRAEKMEPKVSEEVKKDRCIRLLEVAKAESASFAEKRCGKKYRVLCERVRGGFMLGYTENFIYTKTPVSENVRVGEVFDVVLQKEKEFSVETMTVFAQLERNG